MSKTEILLPKKLQVLKTLIVSKVNCARVAGHPIPAFMICTGLNVLNKAPCNVSTLTSDEYWIRVKYKSELNKTTWTWILNSNFEHPNWSLGVELDHKNSKLLLKVKIVLS